MVRAGGAARLPRRGRGARGRRRRLAARDARNAALVLEPGRRAGPLPARDDPANPPADRGAPRGRPQRLRADLRGARLRATRVAALQGERAEPGARFVGGAPAVVAAELERVVGHAPKPGHPPRRRQHADVGEAASKLLADVRPEAAGRDQVRDPVHLDVRLERPHRRVDLVLGHVEEDVTGRAGRAQRQSGQRRVQLVEPDRARGVDVDLAVVGGEQDRQPRHAGQGAVDRVERGGRCGRELRRRRPVDVPEGVDQIEVDEGVATVGGAQRVDRGADGVGEGLVLAQLGAPRRATPVRRRAERRRLEDEGRHAARAQALVERRLLREQLPGLETDGGEGVRLRIPREREPQRRDHPLQRRLVHVPLVQAVQPDRQAGVQGRHVDRRRGRELRLERMDRVEAAQQRMVRVALDEPHPERVEQHDEQALARAHALLDVTGQPGESGRRVHRTHILVHLRHVPEHQNAPQLRAGDHERGDSLGGAPVRPQGERDAEAVEGERGRIRSRGRGRRARDRASPRRPGHLRAAARSRGRGRAAPGPRGRAVRPRRLDRAAWLPIRSAGGAVLRE